MKRAVVALCAALALGAARAPDSGRAPDTNYQLHCSGCHRLDGSGLPGEVPDLRGQVARFLAVPGGRAYLVRVPGAANAPLSDADLAALLGWLLVRFDPEHVPAGFAPYTAAELAALRAQPLSQVKNARAELLAALNGSPPAALPPPGSPRPDAAGAPARRSP